MAQQDCHESPTPTGDPTVSQTRERHSPQGTHGGPRHEAAELLGQGHCESLLGNGKQGSACVCSYVCDYLPPLPGAKKFLFLLLILMFLSLRWHFSVILSLLPFINVWHIYYIKTHSPLNSKVMTFMEHQPENMKLKLYSKFNQTVYP